jgi:hypothetical protein
VIDVSKEKQREQYTAPQVEIVKEIHQKLVSNLQERFTIEQLSKDHEKQAQVQRHGSFIKFPVICKSKNG